jgi:hypothetical protein
MNYFTVEGVAPEVIPELEDKLKANGFTVAPEGVDVEIDGHGCTITGHYDETARILAVTVVRKPFIVSMGRIQKTIEDAIAEAAKDRVV